MTEKVIVQSERQVERLAREGTVAETRSTLARRLFQTLAPDVELASPELTRLALDVALEASARQDPLLAPLARLGGGAWMRTVDALDAALGALRAAGVTTEALTAVAQTAGIAGARARTLAAAMAALDETLARAALVDGRVLGTRLARLLGKAEPDAIALAVGTGRVVARGVLTWDAADVAWWRALDLGLSRGGGAARIELPALDRRLDTERERDPLEVIADDLARGLDEAPAFATIAAPLGDLRFEGDLPDGVKNRVEIRRAADAAAQARAAAEAVATALAAGVPVDRIAIGLPKLEDETLTPLRRALDDAGVVAHDPRGPAPAGAGLVACAMEALAIAARGLPRREVAVLLRSRYLDERALTGLAERREAAARLLDLARALEETPTARTIARDEGSIGAGSLAALVATARAYRPRADRDEDEGVVGARVALATRIGDVLTHAGRARTFAEHAEAARALFAALGLGPRMGAGARARTRRPRVGRARLCDRRLRVGGASPGTGGRGDVGRRLPPPARPRPRRGGAADS